MKLITGDSDGYSASFSDDELFRFNLTRPIYPIAEEETWERTGMVLVSCGLNPSKADAFRDDNTVRKEIGFGRKWRLDWYVKVNAYAWRDTDPNAMIKAGTKRDVTGGPDNDNAIIESLRLVKERGGIALAAWGNYVTRHRSVQLCRMAIDVGVAWHCLGTNSNGSPKHSLYPPYATPLVPWSAG